MVFFWRVILILFEPILIADMSQSNINCCPRSCPCPSSNITSVNVATLRLSNVNDKVLNIINFDKFQADEYNSYDYKYYRNILAIVIMHLKQHLKNKTILYFALMVISHLSNILTLVKISMDTLKYAW